MAEDDMSPEWSRADSAAACKEGWDIFSCSDVNHSPYELQGLNERYVEVLKDGSEVTWPNPFDGDDLAAWLFVWQQASTGSELHRRALAFLKIQAPDEWHEIITYAQTTSLSVEEIVAGLAQIAEETRS